MKIEKFLFQIRYTYELKKHIDDRFRETIGFYRTGKHVIVYSQKVKPCQYLIRTLKIFGLQADDVMKYFANLIERSIP